MLSFLISVLFFSNLSNANIINLNENNLVSIRGPIDSDSTNKFFQDIMKLNKEPEINIFINSPGGSVMEGLKIVNYIEMLNEETTVNCIADFAASMAFIITQSCKNRYAMKSSILMQHQMSLINRGNLFNLNNYMEMINDMNVDLDKSQAKRINISYDDFKEKITNDWWIYGHRTKELNIVDEIINIRCSDRLVSNTEKIKRDTIFGEIEYTFNLCPLVRHPLKVKFKNEINSNEINSNESNSNEINKYYNFFNTEYYFKNENNNLKLNNF
tara:strand:- start:2541 stop:3353 length:813 start_codon:yes stop_codon:yes gene_type:complete